jgi:hypothetical protein
MLSLVLALLHCRSFRETFVLLDLSPWPKILNGCSRLRKLTPMKALDGWAVGTRCSVNDSFPMAFALL